MQQIVINAQHGGFGLSEAASQLYTELSGKPLPDNHWEVQRNCPILVQVVQQLGGAANGPYAKLKVVEIPRYVKWQIAEYDGYEWVAEQHRTWS
jgi:hypothetical protein